jgi:hypothetical protein
MKNPPLPQLEKKRLDELLAYKILDTPPEEEFDSIVDLAATICNVPLAAISFLDRDRQWFKARFGFDIPQTERNHSFCTHTILGDGILIVKDAQDHELFRDSPLVTGQPGVRFYAGIPLRSRRGHALGTLCVMDTRPADLDDDQQKVLRVLGDQVARLMENKWIGADQARTRDIQRHLLEWGKLHGQNPGRTPVGSVSLAGKLLETMMSLPCAKRFSIVDMHKEFDPRLLPEQELHFAMKSIVLWFCELEEEGTVMIDELVINENALMVKLQLHCRNFLPQLPGKVGNPADNPYIILAGDILRKFNGELWMKVSPDRLEASFRMEISAPQTSLMDAR